MVKNLLNGKFYIGASNCVYQAVLNHKSELNRGRSRSQSMQSEWNKYGEQAFAFITLETCHISMLKVREEEWLKKAKVEKSEVAYNKSYRGYNYNTRMMKQLGYK